jgi:hypothetical protein
MKNQHKYVTEITASFRVWAGNNAQALGDAYLHDREWRQRFREYGYGLGDLMVRDEITVNDVNYAIGSAYSTLYVVNCFGHTGGVRLSAKDVVGEIRAGMGKAQEHDRVRHPVGR